MRRVRAPIALVWLFVGLVFCASAPGAIVTMTVVLLQAPSGQDTLNSVDLLAAPETLGSTITSLSSLTPGSTIYLEAWATTNTSTGLSTAGLDVLYDPSLCRHRTRR